MKPMTATKRNGNGKSPAYYHKNPRQITAPQMQRLAADLAEYGDLGGIVHDLNSNELIGGNQRSRVFDLSKLHPIITQKFNKPTKQGTVALGYIEYKGERFAYRAVKWTPKKCEAANVKANLDGGNWDWDILANQFDAGALQSWGMDQHYIDALRRDEAALIDLLGSETPKDADGKEYDETIADGVEVCKCPTCGHEHAKKN